jgi:hypothetical protein
MFAVPLIVPKTAGVLIGKRHVDPYLVARAFANGKILIPTLRK